MREDSIDYIDEIGDGEIREIEKYFQTIDGSQIFLSNFWQRKQITPRLLHGNGNDHTF